MGSASFGPAAQRVPPARVRRALNVSVGWCLLHALVADDLPGPGTALVYRESLEATSE